MRSDRRRSAIRRAAAACVAALLLALGAAPAPAAAVPATAAEGLALGRAVGRALVAFQLPAMCAIPLLVARCRSDFDAFAGGDEAVFDRVPGLGPAPLAHMRSYFATGDPASFPHGFATIRTATAPASLRRANAAAAWAMDEGIVDETVDAALHADVAIYATPPVAEMLRSARDGGPDAAILGAATLPSGTARFSAAVIDRLPRLIDARHPAAAVPSLPSSGGDRGDVELGIGFATVFQLCESPEVAALPESQAFLDQFFAVAARFSTVPGAAGRLARDRGGLRFDRSFDLARVRASEDDLIAYQNVLRPATLRRVLVGQFADQIGYNATVQRDTGFFTNATRSITQWNDADDAYPGLAKRRVALGLLAAGDFAGQRRAALALLGFLLLGTESK